MKGKVFTAQRVQSMIAGDMTMFREVIKHRHLFKIHNVAGSSSEEISEIRNAPLEMDDNFDGKNDVIEYLLKNSLYQVGQKIFCKERFIEAFHNIHYEGTNFCKEFLKFHPWQPAQHMKQEHSRLFPVIKEIRVERLAEISEEDARAEGLMRGEGHLSHLCKYYDGDASFTANGVGVERSVFVEPIVSFKSLWNATHKKPEEKFEANPWVWCVKFEVINN